MSITELKTIIENDDAQALTNLLAYDKATVDALFKALLDAPERSNALGLALTHQSVNCLKILLAKPASETILVYGKYPTLLEAILDRDRPHRDILRLAIDNSVYHLDAFNRNVESALWRYCLRHNLSDTIAYWLTLYPLSKVTYNLLEEDDFSVLQTWLEQGIISEENLSDVEKLIEIWFAKDNPSSAITDLISRQTSTPIMQIDGMLMAQYLQSSGLESRIPSGWLLKLHIAGKTALNKQTLNAMLYSIVEFSELDKESDKIALITQVLPTLTQNTQIDNKTLSYLLFIGVETGNTKLLAEVLMIGRRIKSCRNYTQVALITLICTHSDLIQDMLDNHIDEDKQTILLGILFSPDLNADALKTIYPEKIDAIVTKSENTDWSAQLLSKLSFSHRTSFFSEHLNTKHVMKAIKSMANPYLRIALTTHLANQRGLESVARCFSQPIFRDWLKIHPVTDIIGYLPAKLKREALTKIA